MILATGLRRRYHEFESETGDKSADAQRGAAAIEMAIVLPLLVLLLFGVIEGSFVMTQRADVRADAQETARRAAVNFAESGDVDIDVELDELCDQLDMTDETSISVALPDGTEIGDRIVVTVEHDLVQYTNFFSLLIGKSVTATATNQLEDPARFDEEPGRFCDGTASASPSPTPVPTPTPTPMPGPTPTPTPVPSPTPTPDAPTPTPAATPSPTATPTPTPEPMCTVPDFDNVRKNNAADTWSDAGFTGSVTFLSGPGNYRIHYQSLTPGSSEPCISGIEVGP